MPGFLPLLMTLSRMTLSKIEKETKLGRHLFGQGLCRRFLLELMLRHLQVCPLSVITLRAHVPASVRRHLSTVRFQL